MPVAGRSLIPPEQELGLAPGVVASTRRALDAARGPGLLAAATLKTTASTLAGRGRPPRIVRTSAAERPAVPRQGASMPPIGKTKPRRTTARKASTSRQTTAKTSRPATRDGGGACPVRAGRTCDRSYQKSARGHREGAGCDPWRHPDRQRDLRKDVARLLRDARRDLEKMNKALLRDLEQLQKDLNSHGRVRPAGKPSSAAKRGASKRSSTAKRSEQTRLKRRGEIYRHPCLAGAEPRTSALASIAARRAWR